MIELESQFQVIIASVLFGMVITNLYTFIDIFLKKSKVLRSIVELCFFLISSIVYYFILFKINKGILNVYIPGCLILGYYLHMKFYDKYFSWLYKYLFSYLYSIMKKIKDRWKKVWKGRKRKKIKEKKLIE